MTRPDPQLPDHQAGIGPSVPDVGPASRDPHRPYEELCAGYALSALDVEDESRFLTHLLTCDRCQRELVEHKEVLAHLAYSVPQAAPPPQVLQGIRDGVRLGQPREGVPVDGRAAQDGAVPVPAGSVLAGSAALPAVADLAAARDRRRLRRAGALTAVAAALVGVVGLGAWNTALRGDVDRSERRAQALAATVATLQTGPGRTVPLRTEQGEVLLVAVVQDRSVSLVVDELQPNDPSNSTYVLWGLTGTQLRALGTFDVDAADIDVVRDLELPESVYGVPDTILVSREPGRTAPAAPAVGPLASGVPA